MNVGFTTHGLELLRERAKVPETYEHEYVKNLIENGVTLRKYTGDEGDNIELVFSNGLFLACKTNGKHDYTLITVYRSDTSED